MNRKSKIIVSVVGISIVLLALLGITYAYYLTRIEGNTNTNSISVTTADLKLVYGDGNGAITASDIMPGTTITKDFTVTNTGESKVENYVVVLENIVNTLTRTQDLTYTLTCELSDGTSCGSTELVDNKGPVFPSGVTEKAIFLNGIDKDVTHYYTLVVTYENLTDTDQSDDMGSSISALVNIKDSQDIDTTGLVNPSKILSNMILANYGGKNSITEVTNFNTVTTGLYKTADNMGDGITYYYRGNVTDNYVLFNNMCFRIVRIEGDGSTKLIFAGDISSDATNCNEVGDSTGVLSVSAKVYGYEKDSNDVYRLKYHNFEGGLEDALENWFNTKFNTQTLKDKVKTDKWCLGGNYDYIYDYEGNLIDLGEESWSRFSSGNRFYRNLTPSLMCENEDYVESKFGTISIDEASLAGITYEIIGNGTWEGFEQVSSDGISTYIGQNALNEIYWTLSYAFVETEEYEDGAFAIFNNYAGGDFIVYGSGVRPMITLIPNTTISDGVGTKTNPYVIN